MNGLRFYVLQACGRTLTVRAAAVFLLAMAVTDFSGCARNQPARQSNPSAAVETPAPQTPQLNQLGGRPLPPKPRLLEGSGVAVWAKEYEGPLIAGLDGSLYDPYRTETIQSVQKALRARGLYAGPLNGILDMPTMKSIYAFQEANNLQRCGVPTPHTRRMLEQGSHTDLGF